MKRAKGDEEQLKLLYKNCHEKLLDFKRGIKSGQIRFVDLFDFLFKVLCSINIFNFILIYIILYCLIYILPVLIRISVDKIILNYKLIWINISFLNKITKI